ncbi:Conserved_hypothetical protein [Hexamita inflata]|uniref:Uncharacterized protein n=1 Tax=Hexamita inflata TaxID=28002 RepID=A0AA86PJJ9_9EUKA|nr:Conserved hypothetical protein [Hexamita inflata]
MQFEQIIHVALTAQDIETRTNAYDSYQNLVASNPIEFLEFCMQNIEQMNEQGDICTVLLMKNTQRNMQTSVLRNIGAQGINLLLQRLLATLQQKTNPNLLIQCISEISLFLAINQQDISPVINFIIQNINEQGLMIYQVICNCGTQGLFTYKDPILHILQTAIAAENKSQHSIQLTIQAIASLLTNCEYAMSDFNFLSQYEDQLFCKAIELIAQLKDQKYVIKALQHFIDLAEIKQTTCENCLDNVLQMIDSIFQSQNEDFIEYGLQILEAIIASGDQINLANHKQQVQELIIQTFKCFQFVSNEYKQYVLTQPDFDEADDTNHIQGSILKTLIMSCNANLQLVFDAFTVCDPQDPYVRIMILAMMSISYGHKTVEQKKQLLFEVLQLIGSTDPSVHYRMLMFIINFYEMEQDQKIKRQFSLFLMQNAYFNQVLQFSNTIIIQAAITALATIIKHSDLQFAKATLELSSLIIQSYSNSDLITQKCCMDLVETLISKTKSLELAQFSAVYIQKFYSLIPSLSNTISTDQAKYINQTIKTSAMVVKLLPEHAHEFIQKLFYLLQLENADQIHLLIDTVLDALIVLCAQFSQNMKENLEVFVRKLLFILKLKFSNQSKDIMNEDTVYNEGVVEQHKKCLKALENLLKTLPIEMKKYVSTILTVIEEAQFNNFEYTRVAQIIFQLPKVAIANKDEQMYVQAIELIQNQIKQQILDESIFRSVDEIMQLFSAIEYLVDAVVLQPNDDICQTIAQTIDCLITKARSSFEKAMEEFNIALQENDEDDEENGVNAEEQEEDMMAECAVYWQSANPLSNIAYKLIKSNQMTQYLIELATKYSPDVYSSSILTQFMKLSQQTKPIIEKFFKQFYNYYVEADIKDRPVSQFLYECVKFDSPVIKKTVKIEDLAQDIQDGFQFAFLLQSVVKFQHSEALQFCIQWLEQNPECNAKKLIVKTLGQLPANEQIQSLIAQLTENIEE